MVALVRTESTEREQLLAFLAAQRAALLRAALGLSDEKADSRPSASELSLAGLIKHSADAERVWIQQTLMGRPPVKVLDESNWADEFRLVDGETLAEVIALYDTVAHETEETVRALPDLEITVSLPDRPWFPPGMKVSARWILLHLIQEQGRHAGHADIIRETLDGKTSFELIAEEEQGQKQD